MNIVQIKFLDLYEKQIETIYVVCQYIHKTLGLDDFNLYSENICLDRDTFTDEIHLEVIETGQVHVLFGCYDNLADELPDLQNVFNQLNVILTTLINAESAGVYYLSSNTFDEFKSQFDLVD